MIKMYLNKSIKATRPVPISLDVATNRTHCVLKAFTQVTLC